MTDSDSKKTSEKANDGEGNNDNKDVVKAPDTKKPPKAAPPKPQTKTKGGGSWLAMVGILIAIVAIAASAYLWQSGMQSQQQLSIEIATLGNRVNDQAQDSRNAQRAIDRQGEVTAVQQQKMAAEIERLNQLLQSQNKRILSLSTTDRNDWLLAEAEYLIRLANQRLLMGKEISGAKDLLHAASDIVKELDDAALYPVRKALANDIASLNAANKLDVEWLYLQLAAAVQQAEQLQLFETPQLAVVVEESEPKENWRKRFWSGVITAWDKLKNYIQIRRRDEVYQPVLAPEYEAAVRQNVRLMLEQGQMALLSGRQRLYEDSLNKASDWIKTYYSLNVRANDVILATLEELKQQQVAIELPDISGSLRALKNYLEMMHETPAVPVTDAAVKDDDPSNKGDEVAPQTSTGEGA